MAPYSRNSAIGTQELDNADWLLIPICVFCFSISSKTEVTFESSHPFTAMSTVPCCLFPSSGASTNLGRDRDDRTHRSTRCNYGTTDNHHRERNHRYLDHGYRDHGYRDHRYDSRANHGLAQHRCGRR